MYCNVCNKIENLKKNNQILKKEHQVIELFTVSVVINMKKIFKEEESIEVLKTLSLVKNVEEYQKIYNYFWRIIFD